MVVPKRRQLTIYAAQHPERARIFKIMFRCYPVLSVFLPKSTQFLNTPGPSSSSVALTLPFDATYSMHATCLLLGLIFWHSSSPPDYEYRSLYRCYAEKRPLSDVHLLQRRADFSHNHVHVGFTVKEVSMEQICFFPRVLQFSLVIIILPLFRRHSAMFCQHCTVLATDK